MSTQLEINKLLLTANTLRDTTYIAQDFDSIVLLAYLTVMSQIAKDNRKLTSKAKIDLVLVFLPDLLDHLTSTGYILNKDYYQYKSMYQDSIRAVKQLLLAFSKIEKKTKELSKTLIADNYTEEYSTSCCL